MSEGQVGVSCNLSVEGSSGFKTGQFYLEVLGD